MFPNIATQLLLTTGLIAFIYVAGAAAMSLARLPGSAWNYPLLCLPAGLVISVGLFSSLSFHRPTYLLASPIALAVWLFFRRCRDPGEDDDATRSNPVEAAVFWLATILFSILFCRVWYGGTAPSGMVVLPFKDWGFFSMLVQEIVPSGHMSVWSGAVGEHLAGTSRAHDLWYHWGVIWLAALVRRITGLTAWVSFAAVAVPATVAMAVATLALIIAKLTNWSLLKSFVPAVLCTFFVALGPSTLLQPLFIKLFGINGVLYCTGSYVVIPWLPFECTLMFAAFWAWLCGRFSWCWMCLFFASVSAPHVFIVLATSSVFLLFAGLVVRDRLQIHTALFALVAAVAAWCSVNLIFGAATSKPQGASLSLASLFSIAWHVVSSGIIDALLAIALLALATPGLCRLLAGRGEGIHHRTRILGFFAFSAMLAGVFGNRLLEALGFGNIDAVILPGIARNIVVLPLCALGAVLLLASRSRLSVVIGFFTFIALMALILYDLPRRHAALFSDTPLSRKQVGELSRHLAGGKFGYFAANDRNWWIPVHASLAAVSGSTCIRLNPLPVDEDWAGRQYGSEVPVEIVPRRGGDSCEEWSWKLSQALDIRHLLVGPDYRPPEALLVRFRRVSDIGIYTLWERKTAWEQPSDEAANN